MNHNDQEMLVIKKGYDFSKWLLYHTGKFPKSYRFSIAAKLENGILDFIEITTVASFKIAAKTMPYLSIKHRLSVFGSGNISDTSPLNF